MKCVDSKHKPVRYNPVFSYITQQWREDLNRFSNTQKDYVYVNN